MNKEDGAKTLQGSYPENNSEPLRHATSNTSRNLFTTEEKALQVSAAPKISLPLQDHSGRIPINAGGHSINTYLDPPTSIQWDLHKARISKKKLCSPFHVGKGCNAKQCAYDHRPLSSDERDCMQYALRELPCRKGGTWRDGLCFMGHTCRHRGYKGGRNMHCKLPVRSHMIDLVVVEWITPSQVTGRLMKLGTPKRKARCRGKPGVRLLECS